MQNNSSYFSRLALASVTVFLLSACSSETPSQEDISKPIIRPAKLIEIGPSNNDGFLNFPAVINSQQLSTLSFEVGGVVKTLLVVEAQKVKKGDVLAKLDQRDLKTKLKSARAQYDNANAEYKRNARLAKSNAISRSSLEQQKAQRDVSKAQLEIAQKALQDSVLVAPYAGNIAKVSIKEQEAVQPGKPAIDILGNGGLEATINLPSSIIAVARNRKKSKALSYLTLDVAPEQRISAKFKELALEADAASQTYEASFTFEAPEGLNILPGMNAIIWFSNLPQSEKSNVSVPLTAIVTDGDQKYVWVVDKETMVVARRDVMVIDGVGAKLYISSGLEQGETIVAAGASSLAEGMTVRPWSK